jgi:hypothetical protein
VVRRGIVILILAFCVTSSDNHWRLAANTWAPGCPKLYGHSGAYVLAAGSVVFSEPLVKLTKNNQNHNNNLTFPPPLSHHLRLLLLA